MKIREIILEGISQEDRNKLDQLRRRDTKFASLVQSYLEQNYDWDVAADLARNDMMNNNNNTTRRPSSDTRPASQSAPERPKQDKSEKKRPFNFSDKTKKKSDDKDKDKNKNNSEYYDLTDNPVWKSWEKFRKNNPLLKGMRTGAKLHKDVRKFLDR